jgi:hypothetical protein
MPHLATYIILKFQIKPGVGAGMYPGTAFTSFPSSILDETRYKPITFLIVSQVR